MRKQNFFGVIFCLLLIACQGQSPTTNNGDNGENGDQDPTEEAEYNAESFVRGVDLSYVNQVMDHGGTYQDSGSVENPYKIFAEYGANVARFRLWHDPDWVQNEVYPDQEVSLYSGLENVTKSIEEAKAQGLSINLDFHYSDTWADPQQQRIPEAWRNITDLQVLKDSVYKYTQQTLQHLNEQGLMPEFVQIGNETNCGLLYTNAPPEFPNLNVCDGNWENAGEVINSGIQAVRDVAENSEVDTKIILHVAQPENVDWWFSNITSDGNVSNFDIIGFSYYTAWSDVGLDQISDKVSNFRDNFDKHVMIVETAYPWTLDYADDYNNQFGEDALVNGYAATKQGQKDFMTTLVQEVIDGGGAGVMYWEPAWITSNMKDKWGSGSSWENNTLFDFEGNVHEGMGYLNHEYDFE